MNVDREIVLANSGRIKSYKTEDEVLEKLTKIIQ